MTAATTSPLGENGPLKEPVDRTEAEGDYVLAPCSAATLIARATSFLFGSYAVATIVTNDEGEFSVVIPAGRHTLLAVMPLYELTYEWFLAVSVSVGQTALPFATTAR